MSQVFARSEELTSYVYSVKLRIPEWKVLFAIDGSMDLDELSRFLEMSETEVNNATGKLEELKLIARVGEPPETSEEKTGEDLFTETQVESLQEEPAGEEPVAGEEFAAEVGEEEVPPTAETDISATVEETEEPADVAGEAPAMEGAGEDLQDFSTLLQEETEEEGQTGTEEQPAEAAAADLSEEEIGEEMEDLSDILQEELGEEKPAEEKEGAAADDEFGDLLGDLLSEEGEEKVEEVPPGATEEKPEEEIPEPEAKEGDFDLGSIFDEELPEAKPEAESVSEPETEAAPTVEEAEPETFTADEQAQLEEAVVEAAEEPAVEEPAAEAPILADKTILVVDDSVVIRKMVEIALENENYNIETVSTGKDALKYLDENTPNVIILDIMLPDVNGLDILKAIKASKQIPVVILSAKDTPRETSKAKELGADDFIPKPFKDEELVNKIKELIG